MSDVEWLLREAADEQSLRIGTHAIIDDARWRASIERLELSAGLRVFLTNAEAHHDITVEARDNRTDCWLGSQVTIAGSADIDFLDGQRAHAATEHAVLFRAPGRRAAYCLKAGTRFHSVGYSIDVDRVGRLLNGDVPPVLRALLDDVPATRIAIMPSDRLMRRLAQALFATRFNGPLRLLSMEGVVIQLLAAQIAAAEQPSCPRQRALSLQERQAVFAARDRLLADMRRPPSPGELSALTGLSERRLNAGFRTLFGTTVFESLRNERLELARIAFKTTRLPVKEIAFRVGYNHVSNFINAFTARYGAPPRQYTQARHASTSPLPPQSP